MRTVTTRVRLDQLTSYRSIEVILDPLIRRIESVVPVSAQRTDYPSPPLSHLSTNVSIDLLVIVVA